MSKVRGSQSSERLLSGRHELCTLSSVRPLDCLCHWTVIQVAFMSLFADVVVVINSLGSVSGRTWS